MMMNNFEMNEKDHLWYKLCVYYHAKTELYDRILTDLRSPWDPTEAYIDGRVRSYSYRYASTVKRFIIKIAEDFNIRNRKFNEFNNYHYSAQCWIDEYYRLKDIGEMDFIDKYTKGENMEYYYVENLPNSCYECSCCHTKDYNSRYKLDGEKFCGITNIEVDNHYNYNDRPNWCPLREIPRKENRFSLC